MGIVIGVIVLLVCGYLLAAALQRAEMIRPYLGLFLVAGLFAAAAQVWGVEAGDTGEWLMLAAKLLALLGCLALCLHLGLVVARRLMDKGKP